MRVAQNKRGMAAPRVAEELPIQRHHSNSPSSGLSDRSSSSSSRLWGRPRKFGCYLRVSRLFSRKAARKSFALVLLCLAGVFSLRGWRAAMMIESAPFRGGRWTTTSSAELMDEQEQLWLMDEQRNSQCGWEPGGPLLFNVEHSKLHADGEGRRIDVHSGVI